jgi:hypothetical protein
MLRVQRTARDNAPVGEEIRWTTLTSETGHGVRMSRASRDGRPALTTLFANQVDAGPNLARSRSLSRDGAWSDPAVPSSGKTQIFGRAGLALLRMIQSPGASDMRIDSVASRNIRRKRQMIDPTAHRAIPTTAFAG